MKEKVKKFIKIIFGISFVVFLIYSIPFVIESVLWKRGLFTFAFQSKFSNEVWFGFIASYLGAIGTVVLGAIAFWQNKRYKELSDKSSKETQDIQEELKELNEKTLAAIETLKKIEVAVYTPVLKEIPYTFYNKKIEDVSRVFEEYNIQTNLINIDPAEAYFPIEELLKKYKTLVIPIQNIGEKTIREFSCHTMLINGEEPIISTSSLCDIPSGEYMCMFVSNVDLEEEGSHLELKCKFFTLLRERYALNITVDTIILCDDSKTIHIEVSSPYKE